MKKIITTMLFAGLMSGVTTSQAELTANVALTSDYIWRGISQSASDPALQGGLDYTHSTGLYAGTWGSNVDFWEPEDGGTDPDNGDIEIDVYAGYSSDFPFWLFGDIGYDVGVLRYIYPGTSTDADFTEVYAGITLFDMVNIKYSFSDDFANSGEDGQYLEGDIGFETDGGYGYSVHVGRSFGDSFNPAGADYIDASVGVSKEYFNLGFDLSYYYTNRFGVNEDTSGANQTDGALVLTVSKDFDIF